MDKDDALMRLTEMFGKDEKGDSGLGEKQERRAKAFVIAADLLTSGGKDTGEDLDTIERDSPTLQDAVSIAFAYGTLSGILKMGAADMRGGYDEVKRELKRFEILIMVATMIAQIEKDK
jgi:hypothetical protein